MRLLLVDNLVMPAEGELALLDVHPNLGLLALAASAESAGHRVEILDPRRLVRWGELPYDATLYDRVAERLLAADPDAVGFTTLGCSFLFAVNVAARLDALAPGLPILLGGPHATMLDREILARFPQIDVIARHECDALLPALLAGLEARALDGIPGLSWRTPDGQIRRTEGKPRIDDLDSLPLCDYDHYPIEALGLDLLRVEAGRGCPYSCTFCSTASFFQRSFRIKSAPRLVAELDRLHARYGARDFKLDHDLFTVSRRKVVEFCDAVAGRGYRWRVSARVDCVDDDLLERMARAGCVGLYMGIETGSARMQIVSKKRLDLDRVLPILATAARLGVETTASFITGYPEEEREDQDQTLDLLGRCYAPGCLPQLHLLTPEPGTPMFEQHRAAMAWDGVCGPYNAVPVGPDDVALIRGEPEIFSTYHHYPTALPRARHLAVVDAVALLRRLGEVVGPYLILAWEGRLRRLVEALLARQERGCTLEVGLLELVEETLGPAHHLGSLVRFALQATRAGQAPAARAAGELDADGVYRVADDVALLRGLHDCAALLPRIAALPGDRLLEESEAGERADYVVAPSTAGAVCFLAPREIQMLLAWFQRPRPARELVESGGAPLLGALVRRGILVPAEPPRA